MRRLTCPIAAILLVVACSDPPTSADPGLDPYDAAPDRSAVHATADVAASEAALGRLPARMEALRDTPDNVELGAAYWLGDESAAASGGLVLFSDRGNRQTGIRWVPGDPRRNGRYDVGYASIMGDTPGLTEPEVDAALERAMATWASAACSSQLEMPRGTPEDWLLWNSDILHAGFTPLPEGTLAVTWIFWFVDPLSGEPTDLDADGNRDFAFAITYYSSEYQWRIDDHVDLETVILHETGHGLGQGHFGKLFYTPQNDRYHLAPGSVMNAGYTGIQQALTGTDLAGHCSMFGAWPG